MKARMGIVLGLIALAMTVLAQLFEHGGIGVAFRGRTTDKEPLRVALVFPGSPAEAADIKTNWALISVNGTNVVSMSWTQCVSLIAGRVGTSVTLELADPKMTQTNKFIMRRADVRRPDLEDVIRRLFPTNSGKPVLIAK
jgi:C-terminal processing protease CtpA/Prc